MTCWVLIQSSLSEHATHVTRSPLSPHFPSGRAASYTTVAGNDSILRQIQRGIHSDGDRRSFQTSRDTGTTGYQGTQVSQP